MLWALQVVVMVTDLNCLYINAYTLDTANYEPAMLEVTFVVKNLRYITAG